LANIERGRRIIPRMNPAEMLSGMMNGSLVIGYLMHCMIGIIFAAAYVYIFNPQSSHS
jgi:hypothetical protein